MHFVGNKDGSVSTEGRLEVPHPGSDPRAALYLSADQVYISTPAEFRNLVWLHINQDVLLSRDTPEYAFDQFLMAVEKKRSSGYEARSSNSLITDAERFHHGYICLTYQYAGNELFPDPIM